MQDIPDEVSLAVNDNEGTVTRGNVGKIMGGNEVLQQLRFAMPGSGNNMGMFKSRR